MSLSSREEPAGTLPFDVALPYAQARDGLLLPRIHVDLEFFPGQLDTVPVVALLDTGAEVSLFDGTIIEQANWSMEDVVRQALDVRPMYGFNRLAPPVLGYLHNLTCYIAFGARFATLRFEAVIMPPNTLAFPILGRMGFFQQVDVTIAEFEKMIYLRFRNPAIHHLFE